MIFTNNFTSFTSIFIIINCFYYIIKADEHTIIKTKAVFKSKESVEFQPSKYYYNEIKLSTRPKSGKFGWYNRIYYNDVHTEIKAFSKTHLKLTISQLTNALYKSFKYNKLFRGVIRVIPKSNVIKIGSSKFNMSFDVKVSKNKKFGFVISKNLKVCTFDQTTYISVGMLAIKGKICRVKKLDIFGGDIVTGRNCKPILLKFMPIEENGELEVADIMEC